MLLTRRNRLPHHLLSRLYPSVHVFISTTAATGDDNNSGINPHLIKSLLRSADPIDHSKALSFLSSTPNPDPATCSILFHTLSRHNRQLSPDFIPLLSHLARRQIFPSDSFQLTQILNKIFHAANSAAAWDFLHAVKDNGGTVETPTFNTLLTALSRERDFGRMNKLFAEMKQMGLSPNVVTYGILINHLSKSRRVDLALKVLDEMSKPDSEVRPDVITYNTVIDGMCKSGRVEDGLSILDRMREQCQPNVVTYNTLIDGLCRVGEVDTALELLGRMENGSVAPNVVTLNILVMGMCRNGRISSAFDFFRGKLTFLADVKGNAATYSVLIGAFLHSNNVGKAMELYDEMAREGQSPDSVTYFTLISGLTQAGRMEKACSVALDMGKNGLRLDTRCYNILISGFCRRKKMDKAWELFREMEQIGLSPDVVTYNTLISAACKAADLATACQLLGKMTADSLQPSVVTYGALIDGFCANRKLDEAMKIFRGMEGSRVVPNTVIYNILIESLCQEGEVGEAISLMEEMRDKSISPSVITYNAMFKGLYEKNFVSEAFDLMDKMKAQECEPNYVTMDILSKWLTAIGEVERLRCFVQGTEDDPSDAHSGSNSGALLEPEGVIYIHGLDFMGWIKTQLFCHQEEKKDTDELS